MALACKRAARCTRRRGLRRRRGRREAPDAQATSPASRSGARHEEHRRKAAQTLRSPGGTHIGLARARSRLEGGTPDAQVSAAAGTRVRRLAGNDQSCRTPSRGVQTGFSRGAACDSVRPPQPHRMREESRGSRSGVSSPGRVRSLTWGLFALVPRRAASPCGSLSWLRLGASRSAAQSLEIPAPRIRVVL